MNNNEVMEQLRETENIKKYNPALYLQKEKNTEVGDTINIAIMKLTAVSDFIKRVGDDDYLLDDDTPYGFYLIMGDCIGTLKEAVQKL